MKKIKYIVFAFMLLILPVALTGCKDKPEELSIVISANTEDNTVEAGKSIQLLAEVSDEDYGLPSYEIIEGEEFASITTTGLLTVNQDATNNSSIKVRAKIGKVNSNIYELKVKVIDLTAINISHTGDTNLERGQEKEINVALTPLNPTNKNYTFEITEGNNYATVVASVAGKGLLTIKSDAPVAATVKVKVTQGTVASNVLTFNVIETEASEFEVVLDREQVVLDITSSQTDYVISATAFDSDYRKINNPQFTYTVISGINNVLVSDGVVHPKGHGEARIKVQVVGSNAYATLIVNSVVPPTNIELPSELEGKSRYGFGIADNFDFAINGVRLGTDASLLSQNYIYTFSHNGEEDNTLATVNNDQTITFNNKALNKEIEITVVSDTVAFKNASVSFKVNVNDGVNLSSLSDIANLNDNYMVNNSGNLIPGVIDNISGVNFLNDIILPTNNLELFDSLKYYMTFYGDTTIYGNGHIFDLENRNWYLNHEYDNLLKNYPAPIVVKNYKGTTTSNTKLNFVNIYDLDLRGKAKVDTSFYDAGFEGPSGADKGSNYHGFKAGIMIQGVHKDALNPYLNGTSTIKPSATKLDMDNVRISGFNYGLYTEHVVDSNVKNTSLLDSYSTGAMAYASQITFENITFGKAGDAGIELAPEKSYNAGVNFEERQTIHFKGSLESSNINAFDTYYLIESGKADIFGPVLTGLANEIGTNPELELFKPSFVDEHGEDAINLALLVFNDISDLGNILYNQSFLTFGQYIEDNSVDLDDLTAADLTTVKYIKIVLDGNKYSWIGGPIHIGTIYIINTLYEG